MESEDQLYRMPSSDEALQGVLPSLYPFQIVRNRYGLNEGLQPESSETVDAQIFQQEQSCYVEGLGL